MTHTNLPLVGQTTDTPGGGGCGCGGCGCGASASNETETRTPASESTMREQSTQSFQVTGMTCGHCAGAVTDELKQLPGVTGVAVDLVAGGTSTVRVTGAEALDPALVSTALEEAGDYQLA